MQYSILHYIYLLYVCYVISIPFKTGFQSAQLRKPEPSLELEPLQHAVPKVTAEVMLCS